MKSRIITGLTLLASAIYLIWVGKIPFLISLWILGIAILYEYFKVTNTTHRQLTPWVSYLFHTLLCYLIHDHFIIYVLTSPNIKNVLLGCVGISLLEITCYGQYYIPKQIQLYKNILLISISIAALYIIRIHPQGLSLLLLMIFSIAALDTSAYFSGKKLGKTPLTPISPKKTVEGLLYGLLGCILLGYGIISITTLPQNIIILCIIIGPIASLGDLYVSYIKRSMDIKDSGHILPGHGGLLDRYDSYLLTTPCIMYLLY